MKIRIIKNTQTVVVDDDIEKAFSYLKEKTPLTFECLVEWKAIPFQTVENGVLPNNLRNQMVESYGSGFDVLIHIFEYKDNSFMGTCGYAYPIYNGVSYLEVGVNSYTDSYGGSWKVLAHEMMHSIRMMLSEKGISLMDEMDATFVNGVKMPYYKNDDPYAPDGNFAVMLKKFEPHWDKFKETKIYPLLKEGMRSLDVLTLQTYLKVLGYFSQNTTSYFGPVTKQSVKDFQKANGLVADGVVGKATWNKLLDLVSKKKSKVEKTGIYQLYPLVERARIAFIEACRLQGEEIRVTEGYRSIERQNELYKQRPKVTNAKGGESFHNYGVAFDVIFTKTGYKGNWDKIGKIGKAMGLTWGGDFKSIKDRPHFELTLDYKLKDFKEN
ncbi:MAG TPA: peptidoglycan-binding protein, partial [Candidatus Paceibacterota bacterium]|nr:peptidoglycan-binding protein [Candidatus Paceibacterota bacterium]